MRSGHIDVLGRLWMPATPSATTLTIDSIDVKLYIRDDDGKITREGIEDYLNTHAGDFSEIIDFAAHIDGNDYPWADEDNALTFSDCMYPGDDD